MAFAAESQKIEGNEKAAQIILDWKFKMPFAAAYSQRDNEGDEKKTQMILDRKINIAKEEMVKLQQSYDTAIVDIQKHFDNASAVLISIRDDALKALDASMQEYQKRLRDDLQKMREIEVKLSFTSNDKMHVEPVPNIKFLGNEAFLFQVLNRNYQSYFGSLALNSKPEATDLHLHGCMDSHSLFYTYRIDVPKGTSENDDVKSKLKCQVFQKKCGTSMCLTPEWVIDHFEIQFGFAKRTAFALAVYLLEQHVTGSPINVNSENDTVQAESLTHCEEPQNSFKESITGTLEYGLSCGFHVMQGGPVTETQEKDVQPVNKHEKEFCSRSIFQIKEEHSFNSFHDVEQKHYSDTVDQAEEQQQSRKKEQGSGVLLEQLAQTTSGCFEEHGHSSRKICSPNSNIRHAFHPGPAYGNLINKSAALHAIEANLSCAAHTEAPYSLNRPVGILEHSSGDIFVSDTFNDRVLRLDKDLDPIGIAGPSMGFRRPSSLTELRDGLFAVICSKFIAVFDAEGSYTKTLGKGLLQKPYGLSLSEAGKLLTVETAYPGCLVIVTFCPELGFELSRIRVPLQLPANQVELSKPRFMAIHMDKIYVGDLGLNCIYEVDYTNGCLLSVFGSTGTEPGCMIDPSGIACDTDGNIFVADSRNHRIQVFDPSKKFVCILDVDYPLNRPSGICFTRKDHLFVLNYWDNSVAKYHLKYKFMFIKSE